MWLLLLAADTPDRVAVPAHGDLVAFEVDRLEVRVSDFEAFAVNGYGQREHWSAEGWAWVQEQGPLGAEHRAAGRTPEHPVVAVTYFEAEAYCASRGGRLPTAEEWAWAVCGADSGAAEANWYGGSKYGQIRSVATQVSGEAQGPHGVVNGQGNVWEWTRTDVGASWKALKGGSYANLPSYGRCDHDEPRAPAEAAYTTGFRCIY